MAASAHLFCAHLPMHTPADIPHTPLVCVCARISLILQMLLECLCASIEFTPTEICPHGTSRLLGQRDIKHSHKHIQNYKIGVSVMSSYLPSCASFFHPSILHTNILYQSPIHFSSVHFHPFIFNPSIVHLSFILLSVLHLSSIHHFPCVHISCP